VIIVEATCSSAFEDMLVKVGNDDVISFKNSKQWLLQPPNQARIFADLDSVWSQLIPTYNGAFKNLVYGILPAEIEIYTTLVRIKERIEGIKWTIKID